MIDSIVCSPVGASPPPSRPDFCINWAGALRGSGVFVRSTFTATSWQPWSVWTWALAPLGLPGLRFLPARCARQATTAQSALRGESARPLARALLARGSVPPGVQLSRTERLLQVLPTGMDEFGVAPDLIDLDLGAVALWAPCEPCAGPSMTQGVSSASMRRRMRVA